MNPDPSTLLSKILVSTYTYTDALRRVRAVRQFVQNTLFASALTNFGIENQEDEAWLPSLGTEFYSQFTKDNITSLMGQIESELSKLQPLIIYLPFEIPQGEMVRVGLKLRGEYGAEFLVDFRLDPHLIGGCALVWNNTYKDYSVRQKIYQNKEEILSIIKGYLNKV